ncbi:glycosyltransferase involved in cell wall biosynthesis [Pantoea alhagi]|uniref:glycosyltransferase n=1 Tax=Mixta sp. BE291 TaxID=3158787 RepID=UPI002864EB48|nr:glycosyltransferase involved in cell wall biosynthesis [Pantoea alhagi]
MNKTTFLLGSLSGGGAERVCVNLANSFVNSEKRQVNLLVLNAGDEAYKKNLDAKIAFTSLNVTNARYAFFPLVKYFKKNRSGTVLVFSYELTVLLVIIRMIYKLDFKIVARNINTLSKNLSEKGSFWRSKVVIPIIKKIYGKADYYINQCLDMQEDLIKNFPEVASKSCVINNPIGDELFSKQIQNIKKEHYLLCAGRLEAQKCFAHAISAFSRVHEHYPDLKLVIVGKGSLENELRSWVEHLGVSEYVIFTGFQKDIESFYLKAQATILTSAYEGFPNVILESMALGTPVVAYDCPSGPREILADGVNGYLVEYKNIEGMANSILKLLSEKFDPLRIRNSVSKYKCSLIIEKYEQCFCVVEQKH